MNKLMFFCKVFASMLALFAGFGAILWAVVYLMNNVSEGLGVAIYAVIIIAAMAAFIAYLHD